MLKEKLTLEYCKKSIAAGFCSGSWRNVVEVKNTYRWALAIVNFQLRKHKSCLGNKIEADAFGFFLYAHGHTCRLRITLLKWSVVKESLCWIHGIVHRNLLFLLQQTMKTSEKYHMGVSAFSEVFFTNSMGFLHQILWAQFYGLLALKEPLFYWHSEFYGSRKMWPIIFW